MLKKFSAILLVFIIMTVSSIGAFAGQTDGESASESTGITGGVAPAKKADFEKVLENALADGKAINNGQFIMTITSPDKAKDSTYMKSYVLSGNSRHEDVVIVIAKYNKETNTYERTQNTDGESSWNIGDFRLFSKEILLTEGTNKIKIMAYRTSQEEEASLDNIQVNCFTIELLNETIIEKVIKKTKDISDEISKSLGDLFKKQIELISSRTGA